MGVRLALPEPELEVLGSQCQVRVEGLSSTVATSVGVGTEESPPVSESRCKGRLMRSRSRILGSGGVSPGMVLSG